MSFASICVTLYLSASTLYALFSFWRTQDQYPMVTYPAPHFSPEVMWIERRPKTWVRLNSLPREAWLAIVAAEDGGFFKHNGVEWNQSLRKIRADLRKHRFPGGISTLNQQIVKNLYFGARPAIARKFQEMILARKMDAAFDKKQILEMYMNIVEWGPGIVGIGAAARYYFKKPASRLSTRESVVLANLLPNPRRRGEWVRHGRLPSSFKRLINQTERRLPGTARIVRTQQLIAQSQQKRALLR